MVIAGLRAGRDIIVLPLPNDPRVHFVWASALVLTAGTIMIASTAVAFHAIDAMTAVLISLASSVFSVVGLKISVRLPMGTGPTAGATACATLLPLVVLPRALHLPRLQPDVVLASSDEPTWVRAPQLAVMLRTSHAEREEERALTDPFEESFSPCPGRKDGYGYQYDDERFGPLVDPPAALSTFRKVSVAKKRSQRIQEPCEDPSANGCPESTDTPAEKLPPGVRTGSTCVIQRLPPESIQRTLRFQVAVFSACFPPYVNPMTGQARLLIMPSGKVASVSVEGQADASPSAAALVERGAKSAALCMANALLGITFPRTAGALVNVVWPFRYGGYNEEVFASETASGPANEARAEDKSPDKNGKDSETANSTVTVASGGQPANDARSQEQKSDVGQDAKPQLERLSFSARPGARPQKTVKFKVNSNAVQGTLVQVTNPNDVTSGGELDVFTASETTCTRLLDANDTCSVTVTASSSSPGKFEGVLVVVIGRTWSRVELSAIFR